MRFAFVPVLLAALLPALAHAQQAPAALCAESVHEARYCRHAIQGWDIYLSAALVRERESLARDVLATIGQQLDVVQRALPAARLIELRRIAIWVRNGNDRATSRYVSARSKSPLREGEPAAMMGSVDIRDPAEFFRIRFSQSAVLTHELAHGYHDQVLGYDDARILAAYRNAKDQGLYREVHRHNGDLGPAYALTDHMEYFAELSEAYFARNDFFPFTRDELRSYDPVGFDAVRQAWERPPMVTETLTPTTATDSCSADGGSRSQRSTQQTHLLLRNRTPSDLRLFWLDYEGTRKPYGTIPPGGLYRQNTYLSHPWLLADPSGQCVAVMLPRPNGSYVTIGP